MINGILIRIEDDNIVCPCCEREVFADIFEVDENELPTEHGFHVWCGDPDVYRPCSREIEEAELLDRKVHKWLIEEYFN